MGEVVISWESTSYSNLNYMRDTYFYAFSKGRKLLYVGMTYYQYVADEIRQTIRRLNLNTRGLKIWFGYINTYETTYKRITKQIIQDVECLIIFAKNPPKNIQCTKNYQGRNNLRVINLGTKLLGAIQCDFYSDITWWNLDQTFREFWKWKLSDS